MNTKHEQSIAAQTNRLTQIMARLRAADGCPWDRAQTADSLKPYLLEECYELLDALDSGDSDDICDELGDLLLQVVFLAQIFREQQQFDFADVARTISDKLVRRHPHVFAAADPASHASHWEEIKQQERSARGKQQSPAALFPKGLPALKLATKVMKKSAPHQHTTDSVAALTQLKQRISDAEQSENAPLDEQKWLADILYGAVQLINAKGYDAEDILRQKCQIEMAQLDP